MDAYKYRMMINRKVTDPFWNITTEINQPTIVQSETTACKMQRII